MAKRKPTTDNHRQPPTPAGEACLTGEAILAVEDHTLERVDVPEWNGHVFVRTLSGDERDEIEGKVSSLKQIGTAAAWRGVRALLVGKTVVNEQGERLFTDKQIAALGGKNAAPLDRCFSVAQRLAKLTDSDVDDLVGNSGGVRKDASG